MRVEPTYTPTSTATPKAARNFTPQRWNKQARGANPDGHGNREKSKLKGFRRVLGARGVLLADTAGV